MLQVVFFTDVKSLRACGVPANCAGFFLKRRGGPVSVQGEAHFAAGQRVQTFFFRSFKYHSTFLFPKNLFAVQQKEAEPHPAQCTTHGMMCGGLRAVVEALNYTIRKTS